MIPCANCQAGGSGATRRLFLDPSSNFHPYECDGPGKCIHCDRKTTYRGEGWERHHALDTIEDAKWTIDHDPKVCALCDPEYDGGPSV